MQETIQEMPVLETIEFSRCFLDLIRTHSKVNNTILLGLKGRQRPIRRVLFDQTFLGNRTINNILELAEENLIHSELRIRGASFARGDQDLIK